MRQNFLNKNNRDTLEWLSVLIVKLRIQRTMDAHIKMTIFFVEKNGSKWHELIAMQKKTVNLFQSFGMCGLEPIRNTITLNYDESIQSQLINQLMR